MTNQIEFLKYFLFFELNPFLILFEYLLICLYLSPIYNLDIK